MIQLNPRQEKLLTLLEEKGPLPVREIVILLAPASRITVSRDIALLLNQGWLEKKGQRRSAMYQLSPRYRSLRSIDVDAYFELPAEKRVKKPPFNFDVFNHTPHPFSKQEEKTLLNLKKTYQGHLKKIPSSILKKEFERLTVELSWKSSKIEGNTYSLFETEALLLYQEKAKGHSQHEAQMILNHKTALDFIRQEPTYFHTLTRRKIEELHSLLVKNLNVEKGLRNHPVGITGTDYKPLSNRFQIEDAIEKLCQMINSETSVYGKSLLANLMIAYIQPFMDGNKRTSRMLGNALLLAHDCCPLSFRTVNEQDYKKAVLLFYEQNNLSAFKKLFIEQATFAVENYFLA